MDDCKTDPKHTLEIPLPLTIRHIRPPALILQLRTNHQVRAYNKHGTTSRYRYDFDLSFGLIVRE